MSSITITRTIRFREIVDRTAINLNFDAHVKGAEIEATWEPVPGLRFNFAGGWEDTASPRVDSAIDLMDRTAGNPDWMVVKPFRQRRRRTASCRSMSSRHLTAESQRSYCGRHLAEACGDCLSRIM